MELCQICVVYYTTVIINHLFLSLFYLWNSFCRGYCRGYCRYRTWKHIWISVLCGFSYFHLCCNCLLFFKEEQTSNSYSTTSNYCMYDNHWTLCPIATISQCLSYWSNISCTYYYSKLSSTKSSISLSCPVSTLSCPVSTLSNSRRYISTTLPSTSGKIYIKQLNFIK